MRIQKYKYFSRKINKLSIKKRIPLYAMFELTYRCNLQCVHCYISDQKKSLEPRHELNTKQVFSILEQLKELGCLYLSLTGGEIFLRHDIFDIIGYAKGLGFGVILLTNASLIDENIADRLKELVLERIDITIHAMDRDIFEGITQVRSSYDRVFKAIDLLNRRNILLGLKTAVIQCNKTEVVKIGKFAKNLKALYRFNADLTSCVYITKYSISPRENFYLHKMYYRHLGIQKNGKGQFFREPEQKHSLKRFFNCDAGYGLLTISPYGELKVCPKIDFSIYRILDGTLLEGWQKIKDFVDTLISSKQLFCLNCTFINYCSWCPAKIYIEKGNFKCDFYRKISEK